MDANLVRFLLYLRKGLDSFHRAPLFRRPGLGNPGIIRGMFHWNTLRPLLEVHIPRLAKRVDAAVADIRSFRRRCLVAAVEVTKKEKGADEAIEPGPEDTQTRWRNLAFDDVGVA